MSEETVKIVINKKKTENGMIFIILVHTDEEKSSRMIDFPSLYAPGTPMAFYVLWGRPLEMKYFFFWLLFRKKGPQKMWFKRITSTGMPQMKISTINIPSGRLAPNPRPSHIVIYCSMAPWSICKHKQFASNFKSLPYRYIKCTPYIYLFMVIEMEQRWWCI